MATQKTNLELAKAGDLDALMALATSSADEEDEQPGDGDAECLKWLLVAADFGHDEANDRIDDLLETSTLRYDDDQFESGRVHLELGVAYLTAGDGLARNLALARTHLEAALARNYPASIEDGDKDLVKLRQQLGGDPAALAVFDAIYPP